MLKEMPIKTTMPKKKKKKKTENTKQVNQAELLLVILKKILVPSLWETFWQYLLKLTIYTPAAPAREMHGYQKRV